MVYLPNGWVSVAYPVRDDASSGVRPLEVPNPHGSRPSRLLSTSLESS